MEKEGAMNFFIELSKNMFALSIYVWKEGGIEFDVAALKGKN